MKILIVDDHELIRSGLANLLSQHKYDVVAEAATSSQASALINTHKPEIVLVDINLGSSSGIDLIKEMKKSGSKSKFVVLTMQDDNQTLESAKEAGAIAFITKSAPTDSLLEILQAITTGSDKFLKAGKINQIKPSKDFDLSARELEVLALLPTGATANAIGAVLFLTEATIKTHLANIYRKLAAINRAQAVSIAIENKLIIN
ncbi:two-component system response regulator [Candidatus Nanopelagicus limnes]|uniref:Two-component system response regulator n=1 Tax=Candidatus Nanopelagicus limnae TaxID=1884634 RepID=A0A249JXI4_9ACTN|nr:response regulator transcription factor [Candidatus Nanopelagicus limnes]ASY09234.1 two-component system response regulator [Candidatus Nanopelagicus limnes]